MRTKVGVELVGRFWGDSAWHHRVVGRGEGAIWCFQAKSLFCVKVMRVGVESRLTRWGTRGQ